MALFYRSKEVLAANRSAQAEAYQSIRTNLQFRLLDTGHQSLMVTSSLPEEGKTTTLANLAVSLARSGKRVIAVDADLRRPQLHHLFNVTNGAGLMEVLSSRLELRKTLQITKYPNLRIMTAGATPLDAVALLESEALKHTIDRLTGLCDYVLIDTPPVLPFSDTSILAQHTHAVIMVVRAGKTPQDVVVRAYKQLLNVKAHILGTVLVGVRSQEQHYRYGYSLRGTRTSR